MDPCPASDIDPDLPTLFGSNTTTAADDFTGSCGGAGQPDKAYTFTAPATGTYSFDTSGSLADTVLYVLDGTCSGTELACNDDFGDGTSSLLSVALQAGQTVTLVVDTGDGGPGAFSVNVVAGAVSCPTGDLGSALPAVASGNTQDYLDSLSASCGGAATPDAGFLYTAPATGRYAIDALGALGDYEYLALLYVLDGSCGGPELYCGATTGTILDLTEGQTITVVVDAQFEVTGPFELTIGPAGGVCPDQVLDNALPQSVIGDTSDGDDTVGGSCGGVGSADDTFLFTAPNAGFFTFDTFGSALDTVVYVRQGGCDGAELACIDAASPTNAQSRVTRRMDADETVSIAVDGRDGNGSYVLNVAETPCIDATFVGALPQTVLGTTVDGHDRVSGSCGGAGSPEATWSFTAPQAGVYAFDTLGSEFDTAVYVLDGASCDGPELACNAFSSPAASSPVSVALAAGQVVTVVVDGQFGIYSQGAYQLRATQLADGPCPDADLGAAVPTTTMASTAGGDNTLTGSCGGVSAPDQLYSFTAPSTDTFAIDTLGSSYDTVLYVRDGNCDGAELACNDDTGNSTDSRVILGLVEGQTVVIAVDGVSDAGAFTLSVDLGPPTGDCCEVHASTGCLIDDIEACVCEYDPYCCEVEWDDICVGEVPDLCGVAC